MDFWGFEQQLELPGDVFGLLQSPGGAGASGGTAPAAPVSTQPSPPAPARFQGAEVTPNGTAGNSFNVNPTKDFKQAQDILEDRYKGAKTVFDDYGLQKFVPSVKDFKNNPDTLKTFWDSVDDDPRFTAGGPNPWPVGFDSDIENLIDDQKKYNDADQKMKAPVSGSISDALKVAGEADQALEDIHNHTMTTASVSGSSNPASNPGGAGASSPSGAGNGAQNPGVNTQSQGGGYTQGVTNFAQGIQATTAATNSIAGLVGSAGNVGIAGQYAAAGYGVGQNNIGFGYGDAFGGYNGMIGSGGGFGGVGVSSFGSVGAFPGDNLMNLSINNYGFGGGAGTGGTKRRLEAMINQLLAALASGNLDVLETVMCLRTQSGRQTVCQVASQTVKAMGAYDGQMSSISDRMGELAGQAGSSGSSALIAQANLDANQLSSGRQMIANNLQTVMTMLQEFTDTENGMRRKASQIKETSSRWA